MHVPVSRQRVDAAYLEPMRRANLSADTELFVGLIHPTDDTSVALQRIATAHGVLHRPFGVATECGFGRRLPDVVPKLLRMHAELAAPVV
jgi:hypothetical protein